MVAKKEQHVARRHVALKWCAVLGFVLSAGGCAPGGLADANKLPPNVQDPTTLQTPSGALARYRGALATVPDALDWFAMQSGILTDELMALPTPLSVASAYTALDSRSDLTGFTSDYNRLHRVRAQAREARGFLAAYMTDTLAARPLQGHLEAVEGYAEVFLAELFCSGIPLSTVDFNGDYTLAPGSTTKQVYEHALALFDTALTLTGDSVTFGRLAALGRGRALLGLGRFAEAVAAVTEVPTDYRYDLLFDPPTGTDGQPLRLLAQVALNYSTKTGMPTVGDQEGLNGLDYRSSGDPRVLTTLLGADLLGHELYFLAKYPTTGAVTLTLASGLEARLIEAEAALQGGDPSWLTTLNALRTDGTFEEQHNNPDDLSETDTLWHAGSGGVPGLAPLVDPGSAESRVDLLFRERAFWLYLTGHRQGDLRRLIRQYSRSESTAYPIGFYPGGGGTYGNEVVFPVPASERELNPKYLGCVDRRA